MNRRQALIGIGSLAVGSGAALGSGAFTSVEANRSVDVSVASDSSALLGISPSGPYAEDSSSSDEAVTLSIGSAGSNADGINDDAITNLGDVLTLTNQGDSSEGAVSVSFQNESSGTVAVEITGNDVDTVIELSFDSNVDESSLSAGSGVDVIATVNTGSQADVSNADTEDSVTIVANSV
ncbi:hypothetical protein I7X12_17235 [Halosimplex litoreum]|uniref:DUF1102 domain-containing protein n=1 Tax=Halosimplex litoreum TaxID=1198301 RepID=A0A7T3KUN4_9EURY|nr:hypothetical protein [Halosimplex litoreum]QPV62459.1 hypothetical protein I7X12_17235 [Halosimplex litoreum]